MMLLTGEMWEKAVRYCKEHYSNCHTCEIRGVCWEERCDKIRPRSAEEYKSQVSEAVAELEKSGTARRNKI